MSMITNFGRSATWPKPAASGPTGFGVPNVPAASQWSCQRSSISFASRAP